MMCFRILKEWKYELTDEVNSVEKFMEVYNVSSGEDIQLIDRSRLWMRYLAEAAELVYTNMDGNSIHFRKFQEQDDGLLDGYELLY